MAWKNPEHLAKQENDREFQKVQLDMNYDDDFGWEEVMNEHQSHVDKWILVFSIVCLCVFIWGAL